MSTVKHQLITKFYIANQQQHI